MIIIMNRCGSSESDLPTDVKNNLCRRAVRKQAWNLIPLIGNVLAEPLSQNNSYIKGKQDELKDANTNLSIATTKFRDYVTTNVKDLDDAVQSLATLLIGQGDDGSYTELCTKLLIQPLQEETNFVILNGITLLILVLLLLFYGI